MSFSEYWPNCILIHGTLQNYKHEVQKQMNMKIKKVPVIDEDHFCPKGRSISVL